MKSLMKSLMKRFNVKLWRTNKKKQRANDGQCINVLLNCMIYQDTKIKIQNIFPVTVHHCDPRSPTWLLFSCSTSVYQDSRFCGNYWVTTIHLKWTEKRKKNYRIVVTYKRAIKKMWRNQLLFVIHKNPYL